MSPTEISAIVFICTLGGALGGVWLRTVLPEHHINSDSKDTIKVAMGLIATMTALVLGLVTASTKSAFDATDATVKQSAAEALSLDRLLARYGPETDDIRKALKQALVHRVELTWPASVAQRPSLEPGQMEAPERIADAVRNLAPRDDFHAGLRDSAVELTEQILMERWHVFGRVGSSVPTLFVIVLVFWLTMAFASFGVFAPSNATVIAALSVSALSVASAIFLILELDGPFAGVIKVSPEPFHFALSYLAR